MKKLAPEVYRQRLLIEGYYDSKIDKEAIEEYFKSITQSLNLRMYGTPIIFSPEGMGKGENQGFDAFVPLIDSGISLYVWTQAKFLSLIIYTCKGFDDELAIAETKRIFNITEIESKSF